MPPSPRDYLNSLDSTQLAQLILALEQHGLLSATLPTGSEASANSSRSHPTSSLSGGGTNLGVADMAVAAVHETNSEPLPLPSRLPAPRKASQGWSSGARTQHAHPTTQTTWYTVTVGYTIGIFQGWNAVVPSVLDVDCAVYLSHPSHAATCAHYANAMANNEVEIVLTDDEDDT
ncbi:hypothetical protein IW261DRAFT_1422902 [Armillaria novae-zelandiae]|uniref:Uncharacterized protein n=1 Tax=Armillaria novae-zelandiae TaxID=153914 RepID=A0AA39U5A1_9AGAR|nr:hypothetical protein IW261DRAFT_1422902 [Armillaria novae-zelandiae]